MRSSAYSHQEHQEGHCSTNQGPTHRGPALNAIEGAHAAFFDVFLGGLPFKSLRMC